jgi:hypothetical protein
MRKIILLFILAAVVIGGASYAVIQYFEKKQRDKHTGASSSYADSLNNAHTFSPINPGDIAFLGSTITAYYDLARYFPTLPVKNRGILANRLTHIRGRAPELLRQQPGFVVIEGGIEDLRAGKDPLYLFSEIRDLTDSVLIIAQKAKFVVLTLPPVFTKDSAEINPKIRTVNATLAWFIGNTRYQSKLNPAIAFNCLNMHYLDIYPHITVDMYTDGKLNSKAYLTITHLLTPYFKQ